MNKFENIKSELKYLKYIHTIGKVETDETIESDMFKVMYLKTGRVFGTFNFFIINLEVLPLNKIIDKDETNERKRPTSNDEFGLTNKIINNETPRELTESLFKNKIRDIKYKTIIIDARIDEG